jgi:hypothetical protein
MQEILQQIPHWLQSVSFFLFSLIKSYSGASLSAVFEYSYGEMLLVNFSASIVSILLSYRYRHLILNLIKRKNKTPNGYSGKMKKILINWNKYGFISAMIVSPVLISIPVGVIISAHFKMPKSKIFFFMGLSTFFWINVFYLTTRFGISIFS